jgi:hypothetical protein
MIARYDVDGNLVAIHMDTDADWKEWVAKLESGDSSLKWYDKGPSDPIYDDIMRGSGWEKR